MTKVLCPNRRDFFKITGTATGGLLVSLALPEAQADTSNATTNNGKIGHFVQIEPEGQITVGAPAPDMGQGLNTSLPMLLIEELDLTLDQVEVVQMPARLRRNEEGRLRWAYGISQSTGGSDAIRSSFTPMREMGARVRYALVLAAAEVLQVAPDGLTTDNAQVVHEATGRSLSYGSLAARAARVEQPEEAPALKDGADFKVIGTDQPMVHVDKIVTGQLEYGIDAEIPGMLYASIERAPTLGAKVISFNAQEVLQIPGVTHVVKVEGPEPLGILTNMPIADGVAVVADSNWIAMKARRSLKVEWSEGAMDEVSSEDLSVHIDTLMQSEGQVIREDGDAVTALDAAGDVFEATYDVPFIAHATLEPQNCIAHVKQDGVEIVVPTQSTHDAMFHASAHAGLVDPTKVEVRFTRLGGGFGRRLEADYVSEAVEVSKAIGGPVQVLWTREDDTRNDFYRPSAHHRFRASLDDQGLLAAWSHKLATPGRYFRREGVEPEGIFTPEMWLDDFPAQIVPDMRVEYFFVETAVPTGPWRAPGHTANAFGVQSFIDEIAHARGEDPVEFRLKLLGEDREIPYEQHGGPIFDTGRLKNVVRLAAKNAGWGKRQGRRRGQGIAAHFTFGGYAAHVIDVEVTRNGLLRILKVTSAVDCGLAVNLNGVRAQAEGAINDGLSTALGQEITVEKGTIVQGNFDEYEMMRLADAPPVISVEIVKSDKRADGMGEIAMPPTAPALCNAIFAATGKRIRKLPIGDQLDSR